MRFLLSVLLILLGAGARAADLSSFAFVNDDGSLRIRGRTIHLYGVYIPASESACRPQVRPRTCATRAALALDFKIGPSFVRCDIQDKNPDGSLIGVCRAEGVDLAAYLLERGLAAALPEAPPEYQVLERIARSRGAGIWGFVPGRISPFPDYD